jgi:hypothetical protein
MQALSDLRRNSYAIIAPSFAEDVPAVQHLGFVRYTGEITSSNYREFLTAPLSGFESPSNIQ